MELELGQKQAQTLAPQMIQSASILQMGVQELREFVEQALLENPVLELAEEEAPPAPAPTELTWLERSDRQNVTYHLQDREDAHRDPLANLGRFLDEDEELSRYVLSQFLGTDLEPQVMAGVRFLVEQLDENGWLTEDLDTLAERSGLPRPVMDRALIELQAAEPAGVGARDLPQCLRLQIDRWAGDHRLANAIVDGYLPQLARGGYRQIARALGAEEADVRNACDFVRTLNPRPATGFAAQGSLPYLIPDVEVACLADHFELSLNASPIPHLALSAYYLDLLDTTEDPDVRAYLAQRTEEARWVLEGVRRRGQTLLRCVQWLVERQEGFFRRGPGHLLPLSMEQAAQALGLHVSTVSRAVRDKYFQCPWGVYPLSYLFSRSLGPREVSAEAARALLRRLIQEEAAPRSDRELQEELARLGCSISRRTVAKYREELGIPPASARTPR